MWTRLHRYLGLALALFLAVSGLTGSILVFDPEIDTFLNQDLFALDSSALEPGKAPLPAGDLIKRVEAADERIHAYYIAWSDAPTRASVVYVSPRMDPRTGQAYSVDYDEVFIDPLSGRINGRRLWGECCFEPANFVPFMYKLHNRLLLPIDTGRPLWGIIAILWLVLLLVGAYLALPASKSTVARWKRAFAWRAVGRGIPFNLQLHRVAGLWAWPVLACLALTGAALGLESELYQPLVQSVSTISPTPWDDYGSDPGSALPDPPVGFTDALELSRQAVHTRGLDEKPLYIRYSSSRGLYRVAFGNIYARGAVPVVVYVDARSGRIPGIELPRQGTAGDTAMRVLQPLHAGRVAGLPGRLIVFAGGLVVLVLSVTGLRMWWMKRKRIA